MKLLTNIPLFTYLLAIYNIILFFGEKAGFGMQSKVYTFTMLSGASVTIHVGEMLLMVGIAALYIEIFKATRTSSASIFDHLFSMLTFVAFLVEFLLVKEVADTTFILLTLMTFLDVVAGFTVTISTARRDLSVGSG